MKIPKITVLTHRKYILLLLCYINSVNKCKIGKYVVKINKSIKSIKKQVSGFGESFLKKDIYKCPFLKSAH